MSPVQSDDENLSFDSPTTVNTCRLFPEKPEPNKKLILPEREKKTCNVAPNKLQDFLTVETPNNLIR